LVFYFYFDSKFLTINDLLNSYFIIFLDSEEHEDRKEQKESENTQSAHPDMASIAYISSQNGPEVVDGISMELDKRDLWRTFYRYGTEMIITKVDL